MKLIEQYETIAGLEYALYSTGKGFKTVVTKPGRTLRSGKYVEAFAVERRHPSYSSAINSTLRSEPKESAL